MNITEPTVIATFPSSNTDPVPANETARMSLLEILRDKLIAAYPSVADRPDGEQALAALLGVSVQEVEAVFALPGTLELAEAARVKAEVEGSALEPLAHYTALRLVQRIAAQADTVDAFEAAELIRPIIRVLENADRVRLAERNKDPNAGLAVFNITFEGASMQATMVKEAQHVVIEMPASGLA